jgi:hypothetical protein
MGLVSGGMGTQAKCLKPFGSAGGGGLGHLPYEVQSQLGCIF